jgi:nucleotide-binding universal stress UspA family protein
VSTNHDNTPTRIVVGVDGSTPSKQALRWAARIAAASHARIDAVAAWQFPPSFGWSVVPNDWSPHADTERNLTETVDEVFGADRPANMRLTAREGNSTAILLDESDGALMLIVGSRGHGGFAGLLLGSVSAAVAEHANCPVLVVHGEQGPPTVTP